MATAARLQARGGSVVLAALALAHLVNDSFTALLTPLLPSLQAAFGVSIAQTTALVAVSSFVSSMLQPLFGALGDGSARRALAAVGPLVCGLGMVWLGYAPAFSIVVLLVAISGVGSAVFHPAAIALVHAGSRPAQRGLFAALFSSAGTAGLAVGPLTATLLGLRGLPFLIPVGVITAAIVWTVAPDVDRTLPVVKRTWRQYASVFHGPMRLLWAMGVLRSVSTIAWQTMVGFTLVARGQEVHLGPALATFSIASALGGIAGGQLSDRVGRIPVLRSSIVATIPIFVALVYSTPSNWWFYPLAALVGVMVNANIPVSVVTAQEYAPDNVATASALMMGFTWGTAGVLVLLVGVLADFTSPQTAMVASILLLLPALWLTLRLPEPSELRREEGTGTRE